MAATRTRCQPRAPHGVASLCQAGADRLTFRNVRPAADIPKCAFYQGSLVAHLPKTTKQKQRKKTKKKTKKQKKKKALRVSDSIETGSDGLLGC